jgi:hypothetical protein
MLKRNSSLVFAFPGWQAFRLWSELDITIIPAAATDECNTISGKTIRVFARLA